VREPKKTLKFGLLTVLRI